MQLPSAYASEIGLMLVQHEGQPMQLHWHDPKKQARYAINELALRHAQENPRFCAKRFAQACGLYH